MKPRLTTLLVTLWLVLTSVTGIAAQAPAAQDAIGLQAGVGSNFVYQGFLNNNSKPANGSFDFQFKLYDALVGGTQVGVTSNAANQAVKNGLFTVMINCGVNVFNGSARFLQISVRPANTGAFVALSPRMELAPVPNAQFSSSTAAIQGRSISGATPALNQVLRWNGSQWAPASVAVTAPLNLTGSVAFPNGVITVTNSDTGRGILGIGGFEGVAGSAPLSNGTGVRGQADNGTSAYGVWGLSTNGYGVVGESTNGTGVAGFSAGSQSDGVFGVSNGAIASNGVHGFANADASAAGIFGESPNGFAGYFSGRVYVNGDLAAANKQFKIDHPLDPTNKYLYHTSVESPDMKNIYDGIVTLDANGTAVVDLPSYFQALNQDFRYQLTCIGGFAQIYVDQEIANNRFSIAGGKPGMKVSWQVTGIRHDAYANQNRSPVEETKSAAERGTYLYPSAYGQPETRGVDYARKNLTTKQQATLQKGR
jgi:hypothetical protein